MSELGQTHHPPEVSAEGLAIQLFHSAVAEVPAYRRLISEYGILPESVRSIDDFRRLPITTKQNYHRPNPLPDLCRSGALRGCDMLAVSSGSTGEPAVWPRSMADEFPSLECFEKVLKDAFQAKEMRTLALVCFALGTWVGGMYTASCLRRLGAGGYPITVATPGNQMPEIFRVVR
ncbi:MAG TPA: phenylacetate--CoA ligase family protein, partial [Polyangiaceae bacterium]